MCGLRLLNRTTTPNRRDALRGRCCGSEDESKLATGAGWGDLAMKWFLQFLCIGSVVLYVLLIIIDERIPHSTVETTVISQAQSKQRRLSVWDPYLPYRSFRQDRQASLTPERIHHEDAALASKPYRQSPTQYFDHRPASDGELTASEIGEGKRPTSCVVRGRFI